MDLFRTILIIMLVFFIVMLIKNDITYRNHKIIMEAIYKYHVDCYYSDCGETVKYDEMKSYAKTLWCLWDWGYKRILPKEKFELIKPFIK